MHLKLEMQLNLVPKSRQIVPSQKSSASIVHTRLYQHQNWTDMRKRQLAWILSYTVETDPVKTVHSLLGKLKMILNLRLHFKFKNTAKYVAHLVSLCSSQWFKSVATDFIATPSFNSNSAEFQLLLVVWPAILQGQS